MVADGAHEPLVIPVDSGQVPVEATDLRVSARAGVDEVRADRGEQPRDLGQSDRGVCDRRAGPRCGGVAIHRRPAADAVTLAHVVRCFCAAGARVGGVAGRAVERRRQFVDLLGIAGVDRRLKGPRIHTCHGSELWAVEAHAQLRPLE
jgi:hypothetical protein